MNPRHVQHRIRPVGRLLWRLGSLFGVAALPSLVRAEAETIRVTYSAPDGCMAKDRFEAEISGRTARVRLAEQAEGLRQFSASIAREGGEFVGSVEIFVDGNSTARREIRGEECGEVASALALMIAVAVDPNASTAPAGSIPIGPSLPSGTARLPPANPALSPSVLAPVVALHSRWAWSLLPGAVAIDGVAPELLLGGRATVETRSDDASFLRVFGVGGSYANNTLWGGENRSATIRSITSHLRVCPLSLEFVPHAEWLLCGQSHLGVVLAEGRAVSHPTRETRLYVSLEAATHFRWQFRPNWLLDIGAGAYSPVTRSKFVFTEPKIVVYQMPWVDWSMSLGMGYRFL